MSVGSELQVSTATTTLGGPEARSQSGQNEGRESVLEVSRWGQGGSETVSVLCGEVWQSLGLTVLGDVYCVPASQYHITCSCCLSSAAAPSVTF